MSSLPQAILLGVSTLHSTLSVFLSNLPVGSLAFIHFWFNGKIMLNDFGMIISGLRQKLNQNKRKIFVKADMDEKSYKLIFIYFFDDCNL